MHCERARVPSTKSLLGIDVCMLCSKPRLASSILCLSDDGPVVAYFILALSRKLFNLQHEPDDTALLQLFRRMLKNAPRDSHRGISVP